MNNHKYLYGLLVIFIVLIGCTERDTRENETQETQNTYLFTEELTVSHGEIEHEGEVITFSYGNEGWTVNGIEEYDDQSINQFINDIALLQGRKVEIEEETVEKTKVTLENQSDEIVQLDIFKQEELVYVKKEGQIYQLHLPPHSLNPFDSDFLRPSLSLNISEISEIQFVDESEEIILNKETDLLEVEQAPFISGWYLHGIYDTEFSVEYQQMGELLSGFFGLKGKETDDELEVVKKEIILVDGDQAETIFIGQEIKNKTVIHINSHSRNYLVPNQLLDYYEFSPFEIIDNFIALIPLDAIHEVSIQSPDKEFIIHSDINEDRDEPTFYLNEKEVDIDTFRRSYQYLGRLAYTEEFDRTSEVEEEAFLRIDYQYYNNGEIVTKEIAFFPIKDSDDYLVMNDGKEEFVTTGERIEQMLEELDNY